MDLREEQGKIPFYMTFPMQNLYLMEMEYEKDMERMKTLYPREVQKLMPLIEKRCDELEYEGSRIYDENPDAYMMEKEIDRLFQEIKKLLQEQEGWTEDLPKDLPMRTEEPSARSRFALQMPKEFMFVDESQPETVHTLMASGVREAPRGPGHMPPPPPPPPHRDRHCNGWLCSMVGVLFQDEVYRRRCRHRRCHRWW